MSLKQSVVIVDDNPADIELTKIAFEHHQESYKFFYFTDGLVFLKQLETNQTAYDLILLDLNLPGITGFEILERIRKIDLHSTTPTIIFSTSSSTRDILMAYELGANAFITKPMDFETFEATLNAIIQFWNPKKQHPISLTNP